MKFIWAQTFTSEVYWVIFNIILLHYYYVYTFVHRETVMLFHRVPNLELIMCY